MAYDVFISYRRKGAGAGVAGELQAKLENLGYKVFLDVDEIGSGQFPVQIENAINECKDFLLVLSPGTLDRCIDEEDWVRREIIQAQNTNKNIIGIGLPGFFMPEAESLPEPLRPLTTIQVFSALKKKRNRRRRLAMLPLVLALLGVGLFFSLKDSAAVPDEIEPTDTETIVDNHNETQVFDYHVNRADALVRDLPDGIEFKKDFLQMVSNKDTYVKMMEGLAEYDSAMILKNSFGDTFEDAYNVEAKRNALLELRKAYLETITSDLKLMIAEGGLKFAQQDMEIAYILALPEDKSMLDSLNAIIKSK